MGLPDLLIAKIPTTLKRRNIFDLNVLSNVHNKILVLLKDDDLENICAFCKEIFFLVSTLVRQSALSVLSWKFFLLIHRNELSISYAIQ